MTFNVKCKACGFRAAISINANGSVSQNVTINDLTMTCAVVREEIPGDLIQDVPFCSYLQESIIEAIA